MSLNKSSASRGSSLLGQDPPKWFMWVMRTMMLGMAVFMGWFFYVMYYGIKEGHAQFGYCRPACAAQAKSLGVELDTVDVVAEGCSCEYHFKIEHKW